MELNFHNVPRDIYNRVEMPVLALQKPDLTTIGVLGSYCALELTLKYNETSEGSFEYPRIVNGELTPFYEQLVPDRLVAIAPYGTFVVSRVEEHVDTKGEYKRIELASLESELASKRIVLGQGTYPFYDRSNPDASLLHLIAQSMPNWTIGYVDNQLALRYRTFDDIDSGVLEFFQGAVQENYGAVIVFDTENRRVNAYNAADDASIMPVYLSYNNLLKDGTMKSSSDDLITKLYVQGADGVDIRGVNPTGENYLYNIDWFLANGDLDDALQEKWVAWCQEIESMRDYYAGLVALRSSATMQLTAETAKLTDLQNVVATQEQVRSTYLQTKETSAVNSDAYQIAVVKIEELNNTITSLRADVDAQKNIVEQTQQRIQEYKDAIAAINADLKPSAYFDDDEWKALDFYFKESTFQDETFAVFDVDVSESASIIDVGDLSVEWDDVEATCTPVVIGDSNNTLCRITPSGESTSPKVELNSDNGKWCCTATVLAAAADANNSTMSVNLGAGTVTHNGVSTSFGGGTLTIVGRELDVDGERSTPIRIEQASVYLTKNASDYQQRTVETSLYEYAEEHLREASLPSYEFEVSSGNILFQKEFLPFANQIALGRRCYLQFGSGEVSEIDAPRRLTPVLLEIKLEFKSESSFSLVFANTFRRPDQVNNLKDALSKASSATRTLNSKKMVYGQGAQAASWVQNLLEEGWDAAMTQIHSGTSNVSIGKAGIKVESAGAGGDIIYLGNGMIALEDKKTGTVKMAIGNFKDASGDNFVGVLADVIAGTLLAGQQLIIECPVSVTDNGVTRETMQFKVDQNGVQMYNGKFYMQTSERAVCIDPTYGFMLGKAGMLEWTEDQGVSFLSPVWPEEDTSATWESFTQQDQIALWLSPSGEAYFKGSIYAENGYFHGKVMATEGEFTGTIKASAMYVNGKNVLTSDGKFDRDYLDLGKIQLDGTSGDITMSGNINLSGASSINWGNNVPIKYQYSTNNSSWHDAWSSSDKYRRESYDGGKTWGSGYQFVGTDGSDAIVPTYIQQTYIDSTSIRSPTIAGGTISGGKYYSLGKNCVLDLFDADEISGAFGVLDIDTGAGFGCYDVTGWNNGQPIGTMLFGSICSYDTNRRPAHLIYNGALLLTAPTQGQDTFRPQGTWNFADANIQGVCLTFS